MLPRQYRLPANFRLNNPQLYVTSYFTVKFTPNELSQPRFGFVIGKSVAKQAVQRNHARRILRSCIEECLGNIKVGYDMLFLLKKGIIGVDRDVINKEIQTFFERKHLLR